MFNNFQENLQALLSDYLKNTNSIYDSRLLQLLYNVNLYLSSERPLQNYLEPLKIKIQLLQATNR